MLAFAILSNMFLFFHQCLWYGWCWCWHLWYISNHYLIWRRNEWRGRCVNISSYLHSFISQKTSMMKLYSESCPLTNLDLSPPFQRRSVEYWFEQKLCRGDSWMIFSKSTGSRHLQMNDLLPTEWFPTEWPFVSLILWEDKVYLDPNNFQSWWQNHKKNISLFPISKV